MNPLVTVIVTTSNRKYFLSECIEAVLAQTYVNFELIVVDNFSNYDFVGFMNNYKDARVSSYQNIDNGIIAVNRNFALKKANGDYIAFCDDDDVWIPTKLEKQIQIVNQADARRPLLVYSNAICFGEGIKEFSITTKRKEVKKLEDLFKHNSITYSSVLVSQTGNVCFDELPELRACEDYFLWLNLLYKNYDIVYIDEPMLKYRITSVSASHNNPFVANLRFLATQLIFMLRFKEFRFINIQWIFYIVTNLIKSFIKR